MSRLLDVADLPSADHGAEAHPSPPAGPAILVIPGLDGSGPDHWQSRWEARFPHLRRVEQANWSAPCLADWVAELENAVRAQRRVILVAHSLGCALVAHWALHGSAHRVAAALLVAPPDLERSDRPDRIASFAPLPLEPLPFPAWVVASADDPYASLQRSSAFAEAWGAHLVHAGRAGHINVASGHGDWFEGEALLARIVRSPGA